MSCPWLNHCITVETNLHQMLLWFIFRKLESLNCGLLKYKKKNCQPFEVQNDHKSHTCWFIGNFSSFSQTWWQNSLSSLVDIKNIVGMLEVLIVKCSGCAVVIGHRKATIKRTTFLSCSSSLQGSVKEDTRTCYNKNVARMLYRNRLCLKLVRLR